MVRKQVYLERRQDGMLKRRAKELGVTEAELIRRGVDHVARGTVATAPDASAWREALRVIRRRLRMRVPQGGRSWTREELYEERLRARPR